MRPPLFAMNYRNPVLPGLAAVFFPLFGASSTLGDFIVAPVLRRQILVILDGRASRFPF